MLTQLGTIDVTLIDVTLGLELFAVVLTSLYIGKLLVEGWLASDERAAFIGNGIVSCRGLAKRCLLNQHVARKRGAA